MGTIIGYLLLLWMTTTPQTPSMQRFDTSEQCEAMFQTINHLQGMSTTRHECLPIAGAN